MSDYICVYVCFVIHVRLYFFEASISFAERFATTLIATVFLLARTVREDEWTQVPSTVLKLIRSCSPEQVQHDIRRIIRLELEDWPGLYVHHELYWMGID